MKTFVGLDVSQKKTAVCVVYEQGKDVANNFEIPFAQQLSCVNCRNLSSSVRSSAEADIRADGEDVWVICKRRLRNLSDIR